MEHKTRCAGVHHRAQNERVKSTGHSTGLQSISTRTLQSAFNSFLENDKDGLTERCTNMAWALCFLLAISVSAVGAAVPPPPAASGPGDSIVSATCQLTLRGKNLRGGPDTKDNDYKLSDQGVQEISLACSTVPAGQQVPISVNRTWITPGHTSGFKVGGSCYCRSTADSALNCCTNG